MRALLSVVGTRGDVQPVLALAIEVRKLGHEVRLGIPPNFVDEARRRGLEAFPVGVPMRAPAPGAATPPTPPSKSSLALDLIADQFSALEQGARGCDVIVGANAHQYAARSIAELIGIPCVSALYAPVGLPSPDQAPPPALGQTWEPGPPSDGAERWKAHGRAWNDRALGRVNAERERLGLRAIDDVYAYVVGPRPWLAADDLLAPLPTTPGLDVTQTGDWVLDDPSPLAPALDAFLREGEPPVYVGFGSMPAKPEAFRALVDGVRTAGRRLVLARGWAQPGALDLPPGCLEIEEANHSALFSRVAAVIHHGGAGTTAAAARAGVPQVVVPMFSDQFYWASRVVQLGIGASVPSTRAEAAAVGSALAMALAGDVSRRAREVATRVSTGGAEVAARLLVRG